MWLLTQELCQATVRHGMLRFGTLLHGMRMNATAMSGVYLPNNPYNLNLYTLAEAIIVAAPTMYRNDALTMRTALALVHDSSDILKILVDTGQTVRAGRVNGAFRNIGRTDIADEIARRKDGMNIWQFSKKQALRGI